MGLGFLLSGVTDCRVCAGCIGMVGCWGIGICKHMVMVNVIMDML